MRKALASAFISLLLVGCGEPQTIVVIATPTPTPITIQDQRRLVLNEIGLELDLVNRKIAQALFLEAQNMMIVAYREAGDVYEAAVPRIMQLELPDIATYMQFAAISYRNAADSLAEGDIRQAEIHVDLATDGILRAQRAIQSLTGSSQ